MEHGLGCSCPKWERKPGICLEKARSSISEAASIAKCLSRTNGYRACGNYDSRRAGTSFSTAFVASDNRSVTVISLRLGGSGITKTFTRCNPAERKCRAQDEHLAGGFFCNCEIKASKGPPSLYIRDYLPTWMTRSTANILLLRRSIGLAKKRPPRSGERRILDDALWRSGQPLYERWSRSRQSPAAKYAHVTSTPNCTSPLNIAYRLSTAFSPDYTNQKQAISTCWPRSSSQQPFMQPIRRRSAYAISGMNSAI